MMNLEKIEERAGKASCFYLPGAPSKLGSSFYFFNLIFFLFFLPSWSYIFISLKEEGNRHLPSANYMSDAVTFVGLKDTDR